eukprot:jgi/Undpi1/6137/HiC_scaffold_20.g08622.m1
MPQEIGVDDAKLGLGGGKIEVLLPKAFEEGADVSDVSRGVGVEDDDVVEVGGDAFEVFDDLVDYLDEPPGRGVATLRHDEPLKRREGVQKVARLECRDGCNIAVLRCQPGYSCAEGSMSRCGPGTYRNTSYDAISSCVECPKGTYRVQERGLGVEDCALCPVNTYQNTTGATAETDCIRCPDGLFAELEGTAECSCMTEDSCSSEWQNYQRDSMPYVGRQ